MSEAAIFRDAIKKLREQMKQMEEDRKTHTTRITINKRTHRMRFDGETEDEVIVIIEPHEKPND